MQTSASRKTEKWRTLLTCACSRFFGLIGLIIIIAVLLNVHESP